MIGTGVLGIVLLMQASGLRAERAALDREKNPRRLETAAVAIASSGDSTAIGALAAHLSKRSFLHRLDPPDASAEPVLHLGNVFHALVEHPSPASAALAIQVASSRDFTSVPSRMNFALAALAAVRPLSERAAKVFRETSTPDFVEVNGPLLARNASPRALDVFVDLLVNDSLSVAQRVSTAHWSIVPTRTDVRVINAAARVLDTRDLSNEVAIAVLESLFDYQPRRWFGVRNEQPVPPSWASASADARTALRSLGDTALARPNLPVQLEQTIRGTLQQLR